MYCNCCLISDQQMCTNAPTQVPHGQGAPRTLNYFLGLAAVGTVPVLIAMNPFLHLISMSTSRALIWCIYERPQGCWIVTCDWLAACFFGAFARMPLSLLITPHTPVRIVQRVHVTVRLQPEIMLLRTLLKLKVMSLRMRPFPFILFTMLQETIS
jgi:hypothetical protein